MFDKLISFEKQLFGDETIDTYEIYDVEFWIDRVVMYPSIRPLNLEKVVNLCIELCKNDNFREKLLEATSYCTILVYLLFKEGVFVINEILPHFKKANSELPFYYFRREISDFDVTISVSEFSRFDDYSHSISSLRLNDDQIDQMIEYGFVRSSIEYCLKYDDIDSFRGIDLSKHATVTWSDFEWSLKPDHLDLLSFSGFFGSVRCFKHLMLNDYCITDCVRSSIICSGSTDLCYLCNIWNQIPQKCIINATIFSRFSFLDYFFENGADFNSINIQRNTLLHYSIKFGHLSVLEYLINKGSDMNSIIEYDDFELLSFGGRIAYDEDIVLYRKRSDDLICFEPLSPNHFHLKVFEFLITHGAFLNCINWNRNQLLHYYAYYGFHGIVEKLLDYGADVQEKTRKGEIPLHYASAKGHQRVVELLVNHGSNPNEMNDELISPLHFAAYHGHLQVVEYLLSHGADVNAKTSRNETPLHLSARYKKLRIVKCLINHGADVNSKTSRKRTPLHLSANNQNLSIVECLINHGADTH